MTLTATPIAAAADRPVPTRRVSFEYSLETLPKHFATDGDLVASHLVATLSAVFPDGEDFFVRSVRNFRDQVEDPELKRDVAGFIGQESVHGREHRAFNDRLAELGYPTKTIERAVDKSLRFRERLLPAEANLAATAALEHYTATLAEKLLSDEDARNQIEHDEVRNMFLWHALEENEHKAVAFDVYKLVGGSERMRTITMKIVSIGFVLGITIMTLLSLMTDRKAWNPIRLGKSIWKFRKSPFMDREMFRQIGDYYAADFHPNDRDTTELITEWRAELFGAEGTLNARMPA